MQKIWEKSLEKLSGNLTTNEYMPEKLKRKLLEEDLSCQPKLSFKNVLFPKLGGVLNSINGLEILAGLQRIKKRDHLTVFRAIRFPTFKRIHEMIWEKGLCTPNYEQERILKLYRDTKYSAKRKKIRKDNNFWTQPQERVVKGLPVFALANDALQIHRAFRNKKDKVAMIAIHIPYKLLGGRKIKLKANAAIDLDYTNSERDFEIKDFIENSHTIDFDYCALRSKGIDLHEMYLQNLPWTLAKCEELGIQQEYFLLDVYEIKEKGRIKKLFNDSKTLKKNQQFLHGFFGDQNIFGRRFSRHLPYRCQRINRK
jgi:hypothetical protein